MTDADRLKLLKTGLMISGVAYDDYLTALLQSAQAYISREGVALDLDSIEDSQLVISYAEFLHRQKHGGGDTLPRSLRWALNNRIFSEKAGDTDV